MWLIFGALSVISAFVGFVMIVRKNEKYYFANSISLVLVSLAMLYEYLLVCNWVNHGDYSALEDVVPYTYQNAIVYVWFMVIVNVVMLILPALIKKFKK